ncbi:hypothetical protein E2562_008196 [Oryza meyeriana var. granulata]|uniref:Uncharacterized protein n=1 Tax=Oryza meyeriana var. granulata TaxID=110450 RepID=A0A6G1CG81_9ORYZ|nr:hypothetical protein E2562_008196 [Oryza meyeriana var. granulata]
MASSPETATPPEKTNMGSPPPSPSPSPPLQGNPSLPTDAPPEPSPPDHATPIPPPNPGQAIEEWAKEEEPLPSTTPPIDGTPGAADPPPSFSSLELDTSAAPLALEAAAAGRPSYRSLLPPSEAVEFYPDAASSPSSSYETAEDGSPASPPPTPPPLVLCASPDSSFAESAEMASPAHDPMGADEGSHTAPEPPTPPLESGPDAFSTEPAAMASPARGPIGAGEGPHTAPEPPTPPLESMPEGFQQQQQQPQPSPTTPQECDSLEPAELPLPPTSPAEIAHPLPAAAEIVVVAWTPEEATGSTAAMEVLDAAEIDAVAGTPEEAPGSTAAMEVSDAAEIDAVAGTLEEAPGSTLAMEVTYRETDTTAVSVPPVLDSVEEGSLQESVEKPCSPTMNTEPESMQRPSSPTMDTEPCSPEMAPLGFQQQQQQPHPPPATSLECDSSEHVELPLPPTSPAEISHTLPDAAEIDAVAGTPEEAPGLTLAMEVTYGEADTAAISVPPIVESGEEGSLQESVQRPSSPATSTEPESMQRPSSPTVGTEPCSPEMAPLGFQQQHQQPHPPPTTPQECDSLEHAELLLPPPSPAEIMHTLPHAAEIDVVAEEVAPPGFENFKSSSEPCSLEEMAPPGFENSKSSSEPCSPEEMAPPGFENFKSSWLPLPTLPQTAYASPDAAGTDALAVTVEEAAGPPPALEATDVDMDAIHPAPLPVDSGVEGSLQDPLPGTPSPTIQEASCSTDRAPPGFETYKSSQLLLPSPTLAQTTNVQQDQLVTEAVSVIEEAPQPLHSVEDCSGIGKIASPTACIRRNRRWHSAHSVITAGEGF